MRTIKFTKVQGSGNDFVVIEGHRSKVLSCQLVTKICDRSYGIGADGILLLERSKKADVNMRIYNADGSEADMCGNGARCCALYTALKTKRTKVSIETKAGYLSAIVMGKSVKLKLTDPADVKLGINIRAAGKDYVVDHINTGVPHAVIEVKDLENLDVQGIGRAIRYHEDFLPAGTNVDFIKVLTKDHIRVRTYERGVEDETLACGTGSVASAIVATLGHGGESLKRAGAAHKVFVVTKSGETLMVYFKLSKKKIADVWLQGAAAIVYKGEWLLT